MSVEGGNAAGPRPFTPDSDEPAAPADEGERLEAYDALRHPLLATRVPWPMVALIALVIVIALVLSLPLTGCRDESRCLLHFGPYRGPLYFSGWDYGTLAILAYMGVVFAGIVVMVRRTR
jgi:hypothetical protein